VTSAYAQRYREAAISDLVLHPDNPRQGDIGAISTSIASNGWYGAVVVQKSTQHILAGNHRVQAARHLGLAQVPIIEIDVDDDTALRIMLADNRSSDLATNDEDALARILTRLAETSTLEGSLYDGDELDRLIAHLGREPTSRDDTPPLDTSNPTTKHGDVIQLGPHKLICGDCTDPAVWSEIDDAALIFTSPPYSDVRDYTDDVKDLDPSHLARFLSPAADTAELICINLGLIRRDGAVVPYWDTYTKHAIDVGLKLLSWNVWDRGQPWSLGQQMAMFPIEHEWVFVYGERKADTKKIVRNRTSGSVGSTGNRQPDGTVKVRGNRVIHKERALGTIQRIPPAVGGNGTNHPAVFPVDLPLQYILATTDRGDHIIDPFAGSGTTLIAADEAGRTSTMIEIDPAYCDLIIKRYHDK
jgi:DNA modification methylase